MWTWWLGGDALEWDGIVWHGDLSVCCGIWDLGSVLRRYELRVRILYIRRDRCCKVTLF